MPITYPIKKNRKTPTLSNTSVKFQNINDREHIFKALREREKKSYKGMCEHVNDMGCLHV